jgi:hypothetical protein
MCLQLIEIATTDNKIFNFVAKTFFLPTVYYFKLSGGFCGLMATWLTKWL